MTLLYAEVVGVCSEHGARMGKIRVRGALSIVPLHLVPAAQPGDTVLVCDGVAIGRVSEGVQSGPRPECGEEAGGGSRLRREGSATKRGGRI
jgi:hypothetical protein